MKTGWKITILEDTNVYSSTYNMTRTERTYDITVCPNEQPNWVELRRECQTVQYQPSGQYGNTGSSIITEEDQNPQSATYQQTRTRVVSDLVNCPLPNTTPNWEVQSESCEEV